MVAAKSGSRSESARRDRAARNAPLEINGLPDHGATTVGVDKPLDAHAWLDAAGVEVTGYPVPGKFAEIACFV